MARIAEIQPETEFPLPDLDGYVDDPLPATDPLRPKKAKKATAPAPLPPAEQPTFWETVAGFDVREWSQHVVYLYRLLPRIDSGADRSYVSKYSRAFDEADILADHGSGKYQAILNNTKLRKAVDKVIFAVYAENSPPKVRANQILDLPENQPYRDWVRDAGKHPSAVEVLSSSGTDSDVARRLVELMARQLDKKEPAGNPAAIDPTLVGLFQESSRQRDQLAEKLSTRETPAAASDPIAMITAILTLSDKISQRNVPAADPLALFDRMVDLIGKVKGLSGGGESSEPPGMMERVSGMLSTLFAPAMPILAQGLMGRMNGAPMAGKALPDLRAQMSGQAPNNPVINNQAMQPAAEGATAAPVTAVQPQEQATMDQQVFQEIQSVLFRIFPALLMRLQSGGSGLDFADWVIDGEGIRPWQLLKNVGRDNLIAEVQRYPEAWAVLQPIQVRFAAFLDEFLAWTPIEEEAPAPAQPAAPEPQPVLVMKAAEKAGKKVKSE